MTVNGSLDRDALKFAARVRVRLAHGNQVLVQGDRLVQPLPGLMQGVGAVPNRDTIATTVKGHSFRGLHGPQKKNKSW